MTRQEFVLTREGLYDQVWAEPMWKLAPRYGISDVGLAKICKKMRIPVPGRGYWAKKTAGYKVQPVQLPRSRAGELTEYTITTRSPGEVPPQPGDEFGRLMVREEQAEWKLSVPDELTDPHRLLNLFAGRLRRISKSRNRELPHDKPCLDIRVTEGLLERALRVTDTLLRALEARGLFFEVTPPELPDKSNNYDRRKAHPSRTRVQINEEWVEFGIDEDYDSLIVQPPPRKSAYSGGSYAPPPERERRPNGKLVLRIRTDPYQTGFRRVWRDGKKRRVEDCLNSFICGLINAAKTYRDERLERERWQREREEERRRREEAERLRRQQERLVCDLNSRIEDWHTASLIRQFADAVEGDARQRLGGIDPESDLCLWLKWARQRADQLDANAVSTILQLRPAPKGPSWWSPYGEGEGKFELCALLDDQDEA